MELWFNTYRERKGDRRSPLVFDFSEPPNLEVASPLFEAQKAIDKICEYHGGPYTLLASGGVDSQAMIYAWKLSGKPFSVVHYSYGNNTEDRETLDAFCAANDVEYSVLDFNVRDFITSDEYEQMAIQFDCASPHIITYMKLASLHSETCIMAGNYLSRHSTSLNWTILGLDRFRSLAKSNFVPFFLCSTPGLAYSFFKHEISIEQNKWKYLPMAIGRETGYELKVKAYEFSGFPAIKQSTKLTGFESLKNSYDTVKIDRKSKLKWATMPSKRPFDILFRYGLFDILPHGFYSEKNTIIHNEWINML